GKLFFFGSAVLEILPYSNKPLRHKRSFHQIAAIIFFAESFHLSGFSVPPVRPGAMESIGSFQEADNFLQTFPSLFAGNEAPFYPRKDSHQAKTAPAGSN